MTSTPAAIELEFPRLPAAWHRFPRIFFGARPVVDDVTVPPQITASVASVPLASARIRRFREVCGYAESASVPLTYPHIIAMPLHLAIFADPRFPLRPMGLIHLTNRIELGGELRPGTQVGLRVTAHNYRRTEPGLSFDMTTDMTANGTVLWRETCCFMSRWTRPAASGGRRPPRPPKAPKDASVLKEQEVSLRTAWDYARVSADFNPIHLHDGIARKLGLRGAIVHGMWSLAYALAQAPVPVLGDGAALDTEFLTPVQLPGKVAVKQWAGEGKMHRALCDVRTGRVHMYAHWQPV
jgi:acyl dehydratase